MDLCEHLDDKHFLVRFSTYANESDVEGLIVTSLVHGTGEVHPEWIEDIFDEYEEVCWNLNEILVP